VRRRSKEIDAMLDRVFEIDPLSPKNGFHILLNEKFGLNDLSVLVVSDEVGFDVDRMLRTGKAKTVLDAFKKVFKFLLLVFSGVDASEVVAHYGCIQFTEVAGTFREKMKLANALSRVCPLGDETGFISDFATVYAALDSLIYEEGAGAWKIVTNNPQVFAVVAKISVEGCHQVDARDTYIAVRFFLRRNFKINHFRLLVERIGAERLDELVELVDDGLVDNSILHEFRRSSQLVTDRTKIGLRCMLVDYRNDGKPVSVRQYAEHYIPNVGYQPPLPSKVSPISVQTSVVEVAKQPSNRRRLKIKTRPEPKKKKVVEPSPTDLVKAPNLKTVHKNLDLSGLLPPGISRTAVQAILVHGFARPTEERSFRGGRRLSYEILKRFVRTKVTVRSRKFDRALEWLRKEGVVTLIRKSYKLQPISETSEVGQEVLRRLNDFSL